MNSSATLTADYLHGLNDACRFDLIRKHHGAWQAVLSFNGSESWILDPVSEDYLSGLSDGGCEVIRDNERRRSTFDDLLRRIAYLKG